MTGADNNTPNAGQSLRALGREPAARSLIFRVMLDRMTTAGFGTAIITIVAPVHQIAWVPHGTSGTSGLAALGLIAAAGSAGALFANGVGHKLIERFGVRVMLRIAAVVQLLITIATAIASSVWTFPGMGVVVLAAVSFLFAAATPGISGLARAWWSHIGLSPTLAARGGTLAPTLAAISWSVGPALAAPLVLLSPWTVVVLGALSTVGMSLLSQLPDPYDGARSSVPPVAPHRTCFSLRNWWMAGSYSFYFIARGLLSAGSTAILTVADQPGLIGAASAAPSAAHSVAGIAFAARRDPNRGLRRAVILGLVGQAVPTALIALVFLFWSQPGVVVSVILLIGGGIVLGALKAPVSAAIFPLAEASRPGVSPGLSASRLAQGMTVGELAGPLLGSLIVTTIGPVWLLPASVMALAICAVGVMLDGRITGRKTKLGQIS